MGSSIYSNIEAMNSRRYYDINSNKLAKANAQLASGRLESDPSENPSAAAVGSVLTSTIMAQTQAVANVTQASALIQLATGSLSSMSQILVTMKSRASQANSGAISPAQRSMLDREYQTLLSQVDKMANTTWNGIALFAGAGGTATRIGTADSIGNEEGTTTADISGTVVLAGFVSGAVRSVDVRGSDSTAATINVDIGGQIFSGSITYGTEGNYVLSSKKDPTSSVTLEVTGTGLDSTKTIKDQLSQLFKMDVGAPLSFRSASTDLSAKITSVSSGQAASKVYSLSYGYDEGAGKVIYKLSSGDSVWLKEFDPKTAADALLNKASRTVVFENGFKIITADNNNETAPLGGYEIINISGGTNVSMSFQIGENSSDALSLEFQSATTALLDISGTDISRQDSAADAVVKIESALAQVNNMIAGLGSKKTQLSFTNQSLNLQIQNETAARATFTDADIAAALQDSQQYQALVNMSASIFQNNLTIPKKLADMVASVLRM